MKHDYSGKIMVHLGFKNCLVMISCFLSYSPFWWLNLDDNLPGIRDAQIAGKSYFCVCLWGCFWRRLAFDSVDWVKVDLSSVGGHHPIPWGLEWNKRQREGELSLSPLGAVTLLLPSFSGLQNPELISASSPPRPCLPPLHTLLQVFLRPLDLGWSTRLSFLALQFIDSRSWGS